MTCKSKCHELFLLSGAPSSYVENFIPGDSGKVEVERLKPAVASDGRKTMVAQAGNTKFLPGERHPQCFDCLVEGILKNNRDFILDTLKYLEK